MNSLLKRMRVFCLGAFFVLFAGVLQAQQPSATIDQAEAAISELNQRAAQTFKAFYAASESRLADPKRIDGFDTMNERERLSWRIAYLKEYKSKLIEIYDSISQETNTDHSVNGLMLAIARTAEQLTHAELASELRERVNSIQGLVRRLTERSTVSGLSARGLVVQGSLAGSSETQEVVEETYTVRDLLELGDDADSAAINQQVQLLTLHPNAMIRVDADFLRDLQALIDPVEREQFTLQLKLERLELELERAATATEGDELASLPAGASQPVRIDRSIQVLTSRRDDLINELTRSFENIVQQARVLGLTYHAEDFFKEYQLFDRVSASSREEIIQSLDEAIETNLREYQGRGLKHVEEQLVQELAAWEAKMQALRELSTLNLEERVLHLVLTQQEAGKRERLNNLRAKLSRDEARLNVAKTLAAGLVENVTRLDAQLEKLSTRYDESALRFYGWGVLKVLVIALVAWLILRIVSFMSRRVVARFNAQDERVTKDQEARAKTLSSVAVAAARIVVWISAFFMILSEFDIDYEPLLLATGGLTLAIGFGAQSLVKDFFSGFFILLENQFHVGDVVEIKGLSGGVENVSLRTTRLRGVDGVLHIIPNGEITSVSNRTHGWARMVITIGASYTEDPEEVKGVLNRVGEEMFADPEWSQRLLEAPTTVGVDNFSASSVDYRVMAKTQPGDQWATTREFRRRVKVAFDLNDIEIPYNYLNIIRTESKESKVVAHHKSGKTVEMRAANAKIEKSTKSVNPETQPDRMPSDGE